MFLAAWFVLFLLLIIFFRTHQQEGTYQIQAGKLIISPDSLGHYRVSGQINGSSVQFLIDTGASLVAIPASLATKLNVRGRYPIHLKTAAGEVEGQLTRLKELRFGEFTLTHVKAVLVDGLQNEVLLGMNVLSSFKLSQQNNRLVIEK